LNLNELEIDQIEHAQNRTKIPGAGNEKNKEDFREGQQCSFRRSIFEEKTTFLKGFVYHH